MKAVFPLIPIETFKKVSSILSGNYKTSFQGSGIEFADIREYAMGDSATDIDWRTTARTDKVYVKKYEEEREQKVLFALDVGNSMRFGNEKKTKWNTLSEIFSLLAFSSVENNDPVGAWFFADSIAGEYATKKGRDHLQRIYNDLAAFSNDSQELLSLKNLVRQLFQKKIKNHLIFILSDSLDLPDAHEFRSLADQNDCVIIHVFDTFENTLDGKNIYALDQEGGVFVDTGNSDKKELYVRERARELEAFRHAIMSLGGSYLMLDESKNIYQEAYGFFKSRRNRGL